MDKYQNAVEQIKKGIINYVNNVIRNAPMDKTYSAIITNINEDGTYDIKINNNKYSNINTIGGICSINEVVKVLVPQNNYSRMFILKGGESGKKGTDNYSELENKPSINGVTLVGNKTTEDLNIVSGTDNYSELENKPSINGVTLVGNKTTEDLNIQVEVDKATKDTLGIVKVGEYLEVDDDGKLSVKNFIAKEWNKDTKYFLNDYVTYEEKIYKRINEAPEGLDFNNTDSDYTWNEANQVIHSDTHQGSFIKQNNSVAYGGGLRQYNSSGHLAQFAPILISREQNAVTTLCTHTSPYGVFQYTDIIDFLGVRFYCLFGHKYLGFDNANTLTKGSWFTMVGRDFTEEVKLDLLKNVLTKANIWDGTDGQIKPPSESDRWVEIQYLTDEIKQTSKQNVNWDEVSEKPFETISSNDFNITEGELSIKDKVKNWNEIDEKPFESINSEDFSVSDGVISVKEKDKEWDDISNKPFETINNDEFKIEDGELLLKDNVKEKSISWEDYKKLSDEEIHNGTNYYVYDYPYSGGGGGSGSDVKEKVIAWEDYKVLSKEEKNNGTNYYVYDYPTSGEGSSDKIISWSDYKNLSDEERNNGMTYYVPDAYSDSDFEKRMSDGTLSLEWNKSTESSMSININSTDITTTWNGGSSIGAFIRANLDFTNITNVKIIYDGINSYSNSYSYRVDWEYTLGVVQGTTSTSMSPTYLTSVRQNTIGNDLELEIDTKDIIGENQLRISCHGWSSNIKEIVVGSYNSKRVIFKKSESYTTSVGRVFDSLDVEDSNASLSAKQGKVLNEKFGGLRFGVDGDGNYGYYKADDSFIPFKSGTGEGIAFEVIGSLDESNAVSFEVPKDRVYLCILKYTYAPNYHYIEIIPTVGNYGSRFITSNDYNTIIYNMGGYPLSSMITSKTELEDSIKYTLTKDPSTKGIVELLYFPIDGSPIVPPSNGTIFDYVKEWGTPLTQSGSVVMNIVSANKIVSYWNGNARIGAMMYSKYKIDLTSVKTISCKYFSTSMYGRGYYVHLFVHNTNDLIEPPNAIREVHSDVINEEVELVLDVEDISGEYYLGIAPIGATCDIYDLKFEYL